MNFSILLLSVVACLANFSQAAVNCGIPAVKPDTSTDIVGGKDAIPYSWPWQASLYYKPLLIPSFHTCAATLISNQWLLSAGHCFAGGILMKWPSRWTVKLGVFNQKKSDEPGEQIHKVSEIHIHPQFKMPEDGAPEYDVALLKLEKPVVLSEHITPVCLPTTADEKLPPVGSTAFLIGWGKISGNSRDTNPTLKQVHEAVASNATCAEIYGADYNDEVMFCAGYSKKKDPNGPCNGDSGGPLLFQDGEKWKQIGITSFGEECGEDFSAYSKVPAYFHFIRQFVKDL